MPKHITLIGMMGSGKSTVAPLVAAPLKRPVIEVDALIEQQEGMPIGEIFIAKGEAYFRRLESEMLASPPARHPRRHLPGGGAFQVGSHPQPPPQKHRRLLPLRHARSPHRALALRHRRAPAPQHARHRSPGTVKDLLLRRGAYYGLAHYRIETDHHTPEEVAQSVLLLREAYE